MKKLTLLFIAATLIACGAKDDDEDTSGRTTDPLIGSWYQEFEGGNATFVANSNGTWIANFEEEGETFTNTGGWNNNGSDFDAVRQIYTFNYDDEDTDDETFTIEFNPDFTSLTFEDDETWTRQ